MKTVSVIFFAAFFLVSCRMTNDDADAYGNFEADEVILSAEQGGRLVEFSVREGQLLEAGSIIGLVDTTQLSIRRRQLQAQKHAVITRMNNVGAEVSVMEQQKVNLTREKDRVEKLLSGGAATQKQLDDLEGNLDVLDKQILAVRSQFSNIRAELVVVETQAEAVNDQVRRSVIMAPAKGTVMECYVNVHEMVMPGKALLKLADLSMMYLRAYVSGSRLAGVRLGQKVEVLIDSDQQDRQSLEGVVSWISPEAEFTPKIIQTREERVNLVYAVRIRLENDGRIKVGMPGEVRFTEQTP